MHGKASTALYCTGGGGPVKRSSGQATAGGGTNFFSVISPGPQTIVAMRVTTSSRDIYGNVEHGRPTAAYIIYM